MVDPSDSIFPIDGDEDSPLCIWSEEPTRIGDVTPMTDRSSLEDEGLELLPVTKELRHASAQPDEDVFATFAHASVSMASDHTESARSVCARLNHRPSRYLGGYDDAGIHFWEAAYRGSLPDDAYEAAAGSALRKLCLEDRRDVLAEGPSVTRVRVDCCDETVEFGIGPIGHFFDVLRYQFDASIGAYRLEYAMLLRDFLLVLARY